VALSCSGTLGSAACTFFKLSSGLLLDQEDVIIASLRKQFEEVQKLAGVKRLSGEWATTHPIIPIRFFSLELIALDVLSLRGGHLKKISWGAIDEQIKKILMESEPLDDSSFLSTREGMSLLVLCLLYVAVSDRPFNGAEERFLRDMQRRLTVRLHLTDVMNSARQNSASFMQSALVEIAPIKVTENDAVQILELCHYLAIADGMLEAREARAMQDICKAMQCNPALVDQVITDHETLE
jgi:hypothetical protein